MVQSTTGWPGGVGMVRRQIERGSTIAASWSSEAQRERRGLEAQLGQQVPGEQLSSNQVRALFHALREIVGALAAAEPIDKADLHRELGITLRCDPSGTVTAQAQPRG